MIIGADFLKNGLDYMSAKRLTVYKPVLSARAKQALGELGAETLADLKVPPKKNRPNEAGELRR